MGVPLRQMASSTQVLGRDATATVSEGTRIMKSTTTAAGPSRERAARIFTAMSTSETATSRATVGGGAQRSISELFQVNAATGTMSMAIPIPTTPARSPIAPSLSLNYSSGSGNGAFGLGWDLPLARVSRKTSKHVPVYDDDKVDHVDRFIWNGAQELVPRLPYAEERRTDFDGEVGNYSVRLYELRTANGKLGRMERWADLDHAGDTWWRSFSSENEVTVYGRTDSSRLFDIDPAGHKSVYTWLIDRMYDAQGNDMLYSYKAEDSAGLSHPPSPLLLCENTRESRNRRHNRYLKAIKYGNRTPNRNVTTWDLMPPTSQWLFEVIFDYGEHSGDFPTTVEDQEWPLRMDPFSRCNSGFDIRTYRLCRRILMFHHLPEKLGVEDYLVSSTELVYQESPSMSLLTKTIARGYTCSGPDSYIGDSLPPCEFTYSVAGSSRSLPVRTFDTSLIHNLPGSEPLRAEWVDLDEDGAPGLLMSDTTGTLSYHRNMSFADEGALGHGRYLSQQPFLGESKGWQITDIEGKGELSLVTLSKAGLLQGYQERYGDGFGSFSAIPGPPPLDLTADNILRMDLTGSGPSDLLAEDNDGLVWYQHLGRAGFSQPRRVTFRGENRLRSFRGDVNCSYHSADMTGDGLADIVRVANGRVSYWSNLGYGHFGKEIIMGNSPTISDFDAARLRLADIDGSGVMDIL